MITPFQMRHKMIHAELVHWMGGHEVGKAIVILEMIRADFEQKRA